LGWTLKPDAATPWIFVLLWASLSNVIPLLVVLWCCWTRCGCHWVKQALYKRDPGDANGNTKADFQRLEEQASDQFGIFLPSNTRCII
jgi:hypothetical protein